MTITWSISCLVHWLFWVMLFSDILY